MEAVWAGLRGSIFGYFITAYPWAWPFCEILHFIGMALLIGVVIAVDLRMLGFMKRVPFGPLHRLIPWGIAGFIINLVTGFLFFAGDPYQYIDNTAFLYKMLFIMLAGVNVLVFYFVPFREVEKLGPGEDAPISAKIVAATSIFLWFGVMYMGRMLPFIGDAF